MVSYDPFLDKEAIKRSKLPEYVFKASSDASTTSSTPSDPRQLDVAVQNWHSSSRKLNEYFTPVFWEVGGRARASGRDVVVSGQ